VRTLTLPVFSTTNRRSVSPGAAATPSGWLKLPMLVAVKLEPFCPSLETAPLSEVT
jgi:hypothetical protein